MIKKLINYSILLIELILFSGRILWLRLLPNKYKGLLILDLDNTLADSWPSFKGGYKDHFERLDNIHEHKPCIDYFHQLAVTSHLYPLVLTARSYKYFIVTKRWLNNKLPRKMIRSFYMCPKASNKILFLKIVKTLGFKCIFVDDLSFNHENDSVKFHEYSLNVVRSSNWLLHIGYEELLVLQGESEDEIDEKIKNYL